MRNHGSRDTRVLRNLGFRGRDGSCLIHQYNWGEFRLRRERPCLGGTRIAAHAQRTEREANRAYGSERQPDDSGRTFIIVHDRNSGRCWRLADTINTNALGSELRE